MRTTRVIFGVLVLTMIFSLGVSAWAGENWDKISMGAKSTFGDIVGIASPDAGKAIKTTNFGVGQRVGSALNAANNTFNGVRQSAALKVDNYKASVASIPTKLETKFANAKISFNEGLNSISTQFNKISTAVGNYTGLWGTKAPQKTDFQAAYIYMRQEVVKTTTKSNEPNMLTSNQTGSVFQNDTALSSALKTIGTNISDVTAIKGDVYNSDGSLAAKNAVIVGRDQNGDFNKYNNLSGKTIDVKSIDSQRSY